jgi:hypothetical protein
MQHNPSCEADTQHSSSDCIASDYKMISELWTGNDVEGSGTDLFWGSILEFTWKDQG